MKMVLITKKPQNFPKNPIFWMYPSNSNGFSKVKLRLLEKIKTSETLIYIIRLYIYNKKYGII